MHSSHRSILFFSLAACALAACITCAAHAADTPRIDEARTPLGVPAGQTLALRSGSQDAAPPASGSVSFLRTLGYTALVTALAIIAAVGFRALARRHGGLAMMLGPGGAAPAGIIHVLGRYPVGSGDMLVLLKVDRRVLLLAQSRSSLFGRGGARSGSGFTTLAEFNDPDEVASILQKVAESSEASSTHRFRTLLASFSEPAPPAPPAITPMRSAPAPFPAPPIERGEIIDLTRRQPLVDRSPASLRDKLAAALAERQQRVGAVARGGAR